MTRLCELFDNNNLCALLLQNIFVCLSNHMNKLKGFFIMPGWDKNVCNFYTANTLDIKYGMVK